ncbi:hypothetical protein [Pseudoalteromonas gelatinilytica]|uniref:Phage abortive infection protein n=1 Tax=Pseudoalteromonas gelatinilytica TaxID=1703256 RepID=A0ABQ1TQZ9_9GAMM|nr:hypothetical protein [Pseudoalteromonas profundi]GGF00752.1 hypothetical protein GCM10008027_27060 [Pseudoalteromonas profundi]
MPEIIKQWFIKHMPVEEDIGLHENKAFIRWIGYPLLAILVMVIAVTWNLFETGIYSFNKEFEMSFVTLNDFAKYYAFPIASLTVPLTFGVMFNRFHSSKQKAKSNEIVEQNNIANNFFNHYKYFKEHCEVLEKRFNFLNLEISCEILYKKLFKGSSVSNFITDIELSENDEFLTYIHNEIDTFIQHVDKVGIESVAYTSSHPENDDYYEKHTLNESYSFSFRQSGIYFRQTINEPVDFDNLLQSNFDIIFMLLCFNGVSNFEIIGGDFTKRYWELHQNKFLNFYVSYQN